MKEKYPLRVKEWKKKIEKYERHRGRRPSFPALLVVDVQKFFFSPDSHAYIPSLSLVLPNINKLLQGFRKKNLPVVFTYYAWKEGEDKGSMGRWWKDAVIEGEERAQLVVAPREEEKILRKPHYSAFYKTDLEEYLKDKGVKDVVICGVMTHLCCETTARDAFMRGFDVYFVMDATATFNEELHLSSLLTLSHGFAVMVETEEVIRWLS